MLRLTLVFSVWNAADDDEKILLDRAQLAWSEYRAALRRLRWTETSDHTIFGAHDKANGEGQVHARQDSR